MESNGTVGALTDGPNAMLCGMLFFYFSLMVIKKLKPESVQKSEWKWTNTANSMLHSVITGTGSLFCIYMTPELAADVIRFYTQPSHLLLSFSLGYFVVDFLDIMINDRGTKSTYELIVHHFAVSLCFSISMVTRQYIGYGIVGLLVEVNSIFLHMRQLLKMQGFDKQTKLFRFISLLNIGTLLVFRICTMAWMARWLVLNPNKAPQWVYNCGCISVSIITITSISLFFRLINADFIRNTQEMRQKHTSSDSKNGSCGWASEATKSAEEMLHGNSVKLD